jgi:hypothetical protein
VIADRATARGHVVPKGADGSFVPLGCAIAEAQKGERIIAITSAPTVLAAADA